MKKEDGKFVSEVIAGWGYLREGEIPALKGLLAELPETPVVVNLGAGFGTSSLAMAEERPKSIRHTYDIRPGGPLGGLENEINAFKRADLYPPVQHLQDSAEGGREWDNGEIDIIFIDAGHFEHHVRADIEAWFPHIKDGGIMAFHDYGSPKWPAVKKVVDEVLGDYETITHVNQVFAKRITREKK